jgi:alpha-glucosidase
MGLSGMPFIGFDVGGFIGDGTKDLFKRWIEVGVFSPFCRNHKGFFFTANEPWSYGEEAEAISKSYIGFRYRMMPYMYSAFQQASRTGMPVSRSLCISHPFDEKVYSPDYQYEFMFGDAMLVVPVTTQESIKKIYMPGGDWYDLYTDEIIRGAKEWKSEVPIYKLPVFVKSSSILPLQSLVQSTREHPSDTLMLHVFNGASKNNFEYYEDAGDGFDYQQGVYCSRMMEFDPGRRQFIISKQMGTYHSGFSKVKLIFHGFGDELKNVAVNSFQEKINIEKSGILDPLIELSDYYDPNYYLGLRASEKKFELPFVVFNNSDGQITVTWE